jgi:hypothetical protein
MAADLVEQPQRAAQPGTTIIASESQLVAAHVVYTLAWLLVLIGLPGIYAARAGSSRRTVHALARR